MARKAQRPYTQVSRLRGRIGFSVSGKSWTDKNGTKHDDVPKTEGFIVEVSYESESDKMYHALCNSAVGVQQTLKKFYWANGRFPATPGKVFKAKGDGSMDLPNTVFIDRIAAKAAGEGLDLDEITRLKAAIAMAEAKLAAGAGAPMDVSDQGETGETDEEFKYPEGSLDKVVLAKLKVLAQNEELEGYDELTAEEIREELYLIEKE